MGNQTSEEDQINKETKPFFHVYNTDLYRAQLHADAYGKKREKIAYNSVRLKSARDNKYKVMKKRNSRKDRAI